MDNHYYCQFKEKECKTIAKKHCGEVEKKVVENEQVTLKYLKMVVMMNKIVQTNECSTVLKDVCVDVEEEECRTVSETVCKVRDF